MIVFYTFSSLALLKSCSSMTLWSGLSRESVGATPSSGSFREAANSAKPYVSSLPGLEDNRAKDDAMMM